MARPGIVFAKDWMVDDCGSHASTKYQARRASAKGSASVSFRTEFVASGFKKRTVLKRTANHTH